MRTGGLPVTFNLLLTLIMVGMSACKPIEAPEATEIATTATTVIGTASCTDLTDTFSSLATCETTTGSYCSSGWETFSNGSLAVCYKPATGWQGCYRPADLTKPKAAWLYNAYTLQSAISSGGFVITRSLLGCSSTTCKCSDPLELTPADHSPPGVFSAADFVSSGCSLGSSCTCSVVDCPWGVSNIQIPNAPISAGLTWTLNLDNGNTLASTDDDPTIEMTGALPASAALPAISRMRINLYRDSNCSTSAVAAYTTVDATGSSGGPMATTADTSAGDKNFYFKIYDPVTNISTGCTFTGLTFTHVTFPLVTSDGGLFPSGAKIAGQTVTVDFYNEYTNSDTGVTYSNCYYDRHADDTTAGGTPCSSLPGYSGPSFATTGSFTWVPSSTYFGPYEICVTGTNYVGMNTGCGVYDISHSIYTTNLTHYYDAQFARSNGGAGVSGTTSMSPLVTGGGNATLVNFNQYSGSGWKGRVSLTSVANENALDLDGVNDYVDFGLPSDSYVSETIDLWVMPLNTTQTGSRIIFSHGDSGAGTAGKGLTLSQKFGAPTRFELSLGEPATSTIKCTSAIPVVAYHWYHITAMWDPSLGIRMYLNGENPGSGTGYAPTQGCQMAATGTLMGSGKSLLVGKSAVGTAATEWKGRFGNIKIYNNASGAFGTTVSNTNHQQEKERFIFIDHPTVTSMPNDLANLTLWMNAENIIGYGNGQSVTTTWLDLSSSAPPVCPAANAVCPVGGPIYTNPSVLNGYPAMTFSSGKRFQFDLGAVPANYSVFVVARVTSTNSAIMNAFLNTMNTIDESTYNIGVWGAATVNAGFMATAFGDSSLFFTATGTNNLYTFGATENAIFEKFKIVNSEALYKNGNSVSFTTGGTGAINSAAGTGITFIGGSPSGSLDGDIAEIIIYSRTLSAGERLNIERYLGAKYNITVP